MFAKSKAGVTTPSVITLTAVKQNTSATANWSTSPSLNLYSAASGGSVATTGDTLYLRATELGSNTSVTVTLTCDNITDTQTFALLNEGADGAAGLSALTPILSNSAHTVPADNAGAVLSGGYAGSGTNSRVFEGVGDLLYTSSVTPSAGEFTVTSPPTVSPSGAITPGSFSVSVSDPLQNSAFGLVGKFFKGGGRNTPTWADNYGDTYWRNAAITGSYSTNNIGNIGTLPLDNSVNIEGSGRPGGLLSLNSIDYATTGTVASNYGFIAIGYFKPPLSGTNNYYFELSSDDYSAVWIGEYAVGVNNRTLANAVVVANVQSDVTSLAIPLNGNNYYAIRIVMEEGYGADNFRFRWRTQSGSFSTDLSQNFKAPAAVNGTYNYAVLSGTDLNYNSVSSLVHFETYGEWGSESSSFTNRTFTRGGGAYAAGVPATSPIGSLYALALNGSTDYISFNGPDPLYSGGSTTPWTVECWVYVTASSGGPIFTREYGSGDSEDPSGYDCPIWIGLTNGYDAYTGGLYPTIAWLKSSWYYGSISDQSPVALNTWTHLAFVFTGSAFKMFKDGVDVSGNGFNNITPATTSYDLVSRLARQWYIGAANIGAGRFSGYIDEFRITKGVARYTQAFPGGRPSAPFPSDTTYKPTIALGQGAGGVDVSNHSAMSSSVDVATITYPITAKRANGTSTALSLVQTVTKSKAGAAGASARSVDLTASSYVVNYNADNSTPVPSSITLTATPRNVTGTATYSFNGNAAASATTFAYNPATTYNAAPVTIPVILYENGTQVATDSITISSVKPGAVGSTGAAAITVVMPNDSHVLPTTTAGAVTYTGSGTTIQVYEGNTLLNFVSTLANGSFTITSPPTVTSGTLTGIGTITGQGSGTTATVGDHSGLSTDSATITYTINVRRIGGAGDVTITRTQSLGKSNQGAKGDTGTSALSGYLTNESHTIPADSAGTVQSSDYTAAGGSFKVFFGTTDVTSSCTFGAPSGSTGTVTVSTPDSTGAYTVSGLTTDSAIRTLTATYSSSTISKVYSISKSKSGGAGAAAKTVTLTASGQTFKYNSAGTATPSTQTLTFTVNRQNVTGTASYSIVGYDSSGTSTGTIKSGTSNTFTLTNTEFLTTNTNTVNAVVSVTLDSITDTVTVVKVSDGAKGDAGLAGITAVVSNPSVVLAAASNGTVVSGGYANSGTNIRLLEGSTDLTYTSGTPAAGQFTVASPPTISPSSSITAGSYSAAGGGGVNVAAHVNMTVDAATITYPITLKRADGTAASLSLTQSIAKSKQGQDGTAVGGSTGPRNASGFVYWNTAQSATPTTPSGSSFNFDSASFGTITSGWTTTFTVPNLTGNTANLKYWASRYTVSEATYQGTQTISFSTAFVWTNFDGLVTFTNLADGKDASGTVSKTLIDGASIKTGTITTNSLTVTGFSDSAILNAGFEEQDAADSTLPAKWKRYGVWGGTSSTAYRDTSQSRSGTASLTLNPGAGNSADVYADAIPVNQGDIWYVSCRAKSSGTNAGSSPGFYLRVRGGATQTSLDTELYIAVENVAVPTTWTQYSGQVTIPDGMKWARPILLNYSSNSGAAVTIDEVEFKKATGGAQIADASITTAKIADTIQSNSYSSTAGWQINKTGTATFNQVALRGAINGGSFTSFAWPATGGGFHLGPDGLLLGNATAGQGGKYFQINSTGDIYAPGFTIVNGVGTFTKSVFNSTQYAEFSGTLGTFFTNTFTLSTPTGNPGGGDVTGG